MLSLVPFLVAQGQQASSQEPSTSGGGLSINRSSDRSADEPISQKAVTTGSFGDKGRLNIRLSFLSVNTPGPHHDQIIYLKPKWKRKQTQTEPND